MLSPTRSNLSTMAGRVRSRSKSQRNGSDASEPLPYFPRTTLTSEEQDQLYDAPMPDRIDGNWPALTTPTFSHARNDSLVPNSEAWDSRLSDGPSVIMSTMSSMPSLKLNQTGKKPGSLKATIKRMFGSKRHRTLADEAYKEYHLSDPGNLMNSGPPPNHHISAPAQPRPRPRTAARRNPLGSHAPNPSTDIRDVDEPVTERPSSTLCRRNTLPSITFTEHDNLPTMTTPAMPVNSDHDPEKTIRKNSTSQTNRKRRSRSDEALTDKFLNDGQTKDDRQDRDSEIAFWRNSLLLAPLPKMTPESRRGTKGSIYDTLEHVPSLEHIIKPAQSFDFGLDSPSSGPADIEDRVNTLEVKMYDFEHAIAKLQGVELPKAALPTKQMKRKNVQQMFSKPSIRSLSTTTSAYEQVPVTPVDSPILSSTLKEPFTPDRNSRATTIRPLDRGRISPRSSLRLTAQQYDALVAMIQDEKDARQLMELQILDLQREVELLQAPVYATINYSTPGPESQRSETYQKKLHRSPPFRFDNPPARETSRFSMTESDRESADDSYEETFQTPRQQTFDIHDMRNSTSVSVIV